jgi:peptide/nickel transport system substrate-binding protein
MRRLIKVSGLILVVLLALGITFSGCGEATPEPAAEPAAEPTPEPAPEPTVDKQYGGILRYIALGSYQSSIGVTNNFRGGDGMVCRPCIETIFNQRGLTAELIPMLATSYEWSEDYKIFTLHLREGVKFHDGTPCDAAAIKWNYDRAIAKNAAGSEFFTSVEVVDDTTVNFHTPGFRQEVIVYMTGSILGSPFGLMMSPTAVEEMGEEYTDTHPVGTGPFKFKDLIKEDYIEWERNDDYWGGKPYLDGVKCINIVDPTTATFAFESGEADAIDCFANTDQMYDLLKTEKYEYDMFPSLRTALIPSSGHPESPWANPLVRMATEYAIDKKPITETVFHGYFMPSYFFDPPTIRPSLDSDDTYPGLTARFYDPEKAKELLTEAGYPTGFKTKMYGTTEMLAGAAADAIINNLNAVGIEIDLEVISSAKWVDMETNGWDEGLLVSPTGNDENLATYFNRFWWKPKAPNWATGIYWDALYRPPELQTLLENYMVEPDPDKAKALGMDFVKLVHEQCLAIPLWNWVLTVVRHPYVHDLNGHGTTAQADWPNIWMSEH